MTDERGRIALRASRTKPLALMALGFFVLLAFFGVDWFRWSTAGVRWAASTVGIAFSSYLIIFSTAILFRGRPVFTAGPEGLGMPMGSSALVQLPWDEIEAYGLVTRRIPWALGLSSRVFGVRLKPGVTAQHRFSEGHIREFRLNRRAMGVDVLLTHWFAPDFAEVLTAARAWRPDLERPEMRPAPDDGGA